MAQDEEAEYRESIEVEAAASASASASAAAASAATPLCDGSEACDGAAAAGLDEEAAAAAAAASEASAAAEVARASRHAEMERLKQAQGEAEEKLGQLLEDIGAGKEKLGALGAVLKEEYQKVPGGGGKTLEAVVGELSVLRLEEVGRAAGCMRVAKAAALLSKGSRFVLFLCFCEFVDLDWSFDKTSVSCSDSAFSFAHSVVHGHTAALARIFVAEHQASRPTYARPGS